MGERGMGVSNYYKEIKELTLVDIADQISSIVKKKENNIK